MYEPNSDRSDSTHTCQQLFGRISKPEQEEHRTVKPETGTSENRGVREQKRSHGMGYAIESQSRSRKNAIAEGDS
jgi:hypothetical protein